MLRRILLFCMCIGILQNSVVFAQDKEMLTDYCDDFTKVYSYSDGWTIKSNNSNKLGGDTGRFQRTSADNIESIIYYYPLVEEAEILYYYTSEAFVSAVKIYASSDNESYFEIETRTRAFTGCSGAWGGKYIKTTSIPNGINYIKIEVDQTANMATGCAIGQVNLVKGESYFDNPAMSEPGEEFLMTDKCESFDMLYEKSANWAVDTSNAEALFNDAGRFVRSENTENEYLIYNIPAAKYFSLAVYYTGDKTEPLKTLNIEASSDNEEYTPIEFSNDAPKSSSGYWTSYIVSADIPQNTNFIRISVGETSFENVWMLCFGEISFTVSCPYELKEGNVTMSDDNKAEAAYTLGVNYRLYDNITMCIGAYDEKGLLLNLSARSVSAEIGDVKIMNELILPEETKTVKVFFLNSLYGMHRIWNTIEIK